MPFLKLVYDIPRNKSIVLEVIHVFSSVDSYTEKLFYYLTVNDDKVETGYPILNSTSGSGDSYVSIYNIEPIEFSQKMHLVLPSDSVRSIKKVTLYVDDVIINGKLLPLWFSYEGIDGNLIFWYFR